MGSPTRHDIGARVVLRYRLPGPGPGATDVLGELLTLDADVVRVRDQRPPHPVVEVRTADVLAARVVPARRVTRTAVRSVETASAAGWQPAETGWVGEPGHGWLLRAAAGFTGRANSALPLGDPGMPLAAAVSAVTGWYGARGLVPAMALPTLLGDAAGRALDALGWPAAAEQNLVLSADLDTVLDTALETEHGTAPAVLTRLAPEPDAGWLGGYHYRGGTLPDTAPDVLARGDRLAFLTLQVGGEQVGIARGALSEDDAGSTWLGVTAVEVNPAHRRRGLGRLAVTALARWAADHGAQALYLQVAEANTAARGAYGALGLREHHRYVYRRAAADTLSGR